MDKISFIIPDDHTKIKNNSLNKSESKDSKIDVQLQDKTVSVNNITDYIQIAPNVYRFVSNNLNLDNKHDIYILYNNACQAKNENKHVAFEMFKRCHELIDNNTKDEVKYEIYVNLALLSSECGCTSVQVGNYYEQALKVCSDRAEPYYYWSIYCNKNNNFEKAYELLKKALLLDYKDAVIKYPKTQFTAYGKYLHDELSVSASWLKKYEEAKVLIEQIINDPDFSASKERLLKNLEIVKKNL